MYHITGKIKLIGETQQVSEKFRKRDFVITDNTSSQYPQYISFQLTQDKCSLIDNYTVGSDIKVHFNLRGREWTSPKGEVKYFNTIEAWRLEKLSVGGAETTTNADTTYSPTPAPEIPETTFTSDTILDNDLPF